MQRNPALLLLMLDNLVQCNPGSHLRHTSRVSTIFRTGRLSRQVVVLHALDHSRAPSDSQSKRPICTADSAARGTHKRRHA